jgi:hypothetical protein
VLATARVRVDPAGWLAGWHAWQAERGHGAVVRWLLRDVGAEAAGLEMKERHGRTALGAAAGAAARGGGQRAGRGARAETLLDVVRLLAKYGAAVDTEDARSVTPLLDAARAGSVSTVSTLLELGATEDVEVALLDVEAQRQAAKDRSSKRHKQQGARKGSIDPTAEAAADDSPLASLATMLRRAMPANDDDDDDDEDDDDEDDDDRDL